jgi:transcriptional regulator GlxA family with amidase domain
MQKIGFLIFDQVDELDFVGPLEVFGMAKRFGAECQPFVIADERSPVLCQHGLRVVPDHGFADCPALDMLVIPGGSGARTHAQQNGRILRFVRQQKGFVASVCTGALIVAAAGFLRGRSATTHHSAFDLLREYEGVRVQEGVRFLMSDRVASAAGVSAGIDLALGLVARLWGEGISQIVAANLEWQSSAWKANVRSVQGLQG